MDINEDLLIELKQTAETAAVEAGHLLRNLWYKPRTISHKGFRDLVTDADIAAQQCITNIIREQFPTHGFMTEEADPDLPNGGEIIWVIDPLDGTSNYSYQLPNFCVSIAAVNSQEESLVGAIYAPMYDELYVGMQGAESTCNGQVIGASDRTDIADSILGFDWSREPANRAGILENINRLASQVHTIRTVGSAALTLAWVASGRLDGYFNFSFYPWDAAAGALIIRQAGGIISLVSGEPWTLHARNCVATNTPLYKAFQSQLSWAG